MLRLLLLVVLSITSAAAQTIVCVGDSLTAGLGLSPEEAYPAQIEALAAHDGLHWRVINAGVSGDTSAGGRRRMAWVLKSKPDLVFLALGANDGLRGVPPDQTQANLEAIVDECRKASVAVALAGMQLPRNYGEDYRAAFAAVFPAVAKQRALPLMPFLLTDVGGVAALNQADAIHPTAAGHKIIAKHVYDFLRTVLKPGEKEK